MRRPPALPLRRCLRLPLRVRPALRPAMPLGPGLLRGNSDKCPHAGRAYGMISAWPMPRRIRA